MTCRNSELEKMKLNKCLICVALCLASATSLQAQVVQNPGFEDAGLADGAGTGDGPAWVESGNAGAFNPTSAVHYTQDNPLASPAAGEHVGYVNPLATLCQDIGGTIQAGGFYELEVAVGWRKDDPVEPAYQIEIRAATSNNLKAFATAPGTVLDNWVLSTASFTAGSGDPDLGDALEICLVNTNSNGQVNFDEVVFRTVIPFLINAGLNDAWVHDGAPFQGFFFTVFPDLGFFFLAWFTFDSVPPGIGVPPAVFGASDQRWVTGGNFYSGDSVTLSMELTSGGIFNGSDPLAIQESDYGTITIVFINCNEALLTYDFPSLGLSGQMTVTRAVPDNVPLCEALNAELQMMQ